MFSISFLADTKSSFNFVFVLSSFADLIFVLYSISRSFKILILSSSMTFVTIYLAKYIIFSTALAEIPNIKLILEGILRKNQICDTGVQSSICAILSRRTIDRVISTPHLSHIIPLYRMPLYLPQ